MAGVAYGDRFDAKIVAQAEGFARACFADYEDYQRRWAPYEDKHRASFVKAQQIKNYYAKLDALRALAVAYRDDVKASTLAEADEHGSATAQFLWSAGLAAEIDGYLAELAETRGSGPNTIFHSSMPAFSDDTLRGDVYCHLAIQQGTHRTRQTPSWLKMGEILPEPRLRALNGYLATMDHPSSPVESSGKRYSSQEFQTWVTHHMAFEPRSQITVGGVVEVLHVAASGATLRVSQSFGSSTESDCRQTRKIDRVTANGDVHHHEVCKISGSSTKLIFDLKFADAPPILKVGDWIDFTSEFENQIDGPRGSGPLPATITFHLKGLLVDQVARRNDRTQKLEPVARYATL